MSFVLLLPNDQARLGESTERFQRGLYPGRLHIANNPDFNLYFQHNICYYILHGCIAIV